MKKHLLNLVALIAVLMVLTTGGLLSQGWNKEDLKTIKDFNEIKKSFDNYWIDKDYQEKGKGWKIFKRWEWFWGQRVYPDGLFPSPDKTYIEYQKRLRADKKNLDNTLTVGNWENLGPTTNNGGYGGLGRINVVREHPSNSNTIYAGAASGGLWMSTDGGNNWSTNTDELGSLGVTDLVFDPDDSNIIFMATGDGDHSDTYSVGVLKSTNGGASWNTTGLNWTQNNNRTISRLLINPVNSDFIYAGGSNGIYKSTNGGTDWSLVFNTMSVKDMELKPGTPSTIYAARNAIYRSTDNGTSWTQLTSGLPTSGMERIALAVSPNNANYVYALISSTSGSGFLGLYRSTNSGDSWTLMSSTPNILGWNVTGSDTGGQGWYDLCLAASPTNANEIYAGGVNIWKSTNGGVNWTRSTYWNSAYTPTVHADQHDLWFSTNSNTLYVGNDGGVYHTTNGGTNWSWVGSGLQISQFYRLGVSATNSNIVIAGAQDNGTKLKSGTNWTDVIGGDGMECIVDHSNANIMYGSIYYGQIRKSTNGGSSFNTLTLPSEYNSGYGAWVTPYVMDPTNSNILYVGYRNIFKTTNGGGSWTSISNFTSGSITVLQVAPSNTNYIYASTGGSYLKATTNGGANWTEYALPAYTTLTYLAVDNDNPLNIWATFSGYYSGQKVYNSTNGGQSWTNISGTLPNLPVNCVVHQKDFNDRIYVGTDIGVYYRDNNTDNWVSFNTNLPNVVITELEIQYSTNKLRAATFGRGLWEAEIAVTSLDSPTLASPADAATDQELTLSLAWNAVTNATSYTSQLSTSSDFTTNNESTTTTTSRDISGLDYSTTYYWRVKAYDGNNYSDWSTTRSYTTRQLTLEAPVLSSPANNLSDAEISQTLSWGSVSNATGYTLQYSTVSDFSTASQVDLTGTTHNISGLNYNTSYYWRVKATNGGIESNWSSVFSFTTYQLTLDAPVLSTPANNLADANISLSLSWSSVSNATGYTLQYTTLSDFSAGTEVDITGTSYDITGLNYNTSYYWRVKATNGGIESNWSSVFSFTTYQPTLDAPTLGSPSNLATDVTLSPTLSWNEVSGATTYFVEYSTSSDFSTKTEAAVTTTTKNLSSLSYSTTYYWRVKAFDGNVYSDWSNSFSFTTESLTLSSPNLLTPGSDATAVNTTVTLDWTDVTNAAEYIVQYSTSSNFATYNEYSTTSSGKEITGLNYNANYYWRAKAINGQIHSNWSTARSFATETLTLGNTSLINPRNNTRNIQINVVVEYTAVTNATGYVVQYSTSSNFSNPTEVASTTTSCQLALDYSKTYYWRVKATAGNISGGWCASRKFQTVKAKYGMPGEDLLADYEEFMVTPNPVQSNANLIFYVDEEREVELAVYDLNGQMVMNVIRGRLSEGEHIYNIDANGLSNGIYVAVLKTGDFVLTRKVVVMK